MSRDAVQSRAQELQIRMNSVPSLLWIFNAHATHKFNERNNRNEVRNVFSIDWDELMCSTDLFCALVLLPAESYRARWTFWCMSNGKTNRITRGKFNQKNNNRPQIFRSSRMELRERLTKVKRSEDDTIKAALGFFVISFIYLSASNVYPMNVACPLWFDMILFRFVFVLLSLIFVAAAAAAWLK